ncbi:DUF2141 domain-containing protein [Sphingomonas sp. GCM10030256]|uniref:DUF2141 domain-containing protein n=1 Tax=Sphingomonas sp. GCM10030256 TaxID=3273427 RepID=UPI0036213523
MLKLRTPVLLAAAAALVLPVGMPGSAAAAVVVGKDAATCQSGKPAVQVRVSGFKQASGTVRVTLYDARGYLKKKSSLRKVRVPVNSRGAMDVCVAVPKPGRYSVAVQHDLNGNRDLDRADGGGFSRNPGLSLVGARPSFARTSFDVGSGPRMVPVTLQYLKGLRIGPVES